MAYEQSFGAPTMHLGSEGDVSHKQKWSSVSQSAMMLENSNGGFDCNICLESCHEPVVTLCGHLYCWPCIYKWLHVQSSSFESDERPRCPVCKAFISNSSLVPLYGRGRSPSESEAKKRQLDSTVPPRPAALGLNTLLDTSASVSSDSNQQNNPNPFHQDNQTFDQQQRFPNPFGNYSSIPPPTTTSFFSPTINMVSEIVFAGMFGSSDSNMFAYPYTNSYPLIGNGSPRLRRHEVQLDKSLNRVSIFLFCCIALCLILF
ncbi:E3 ubiquitin-protein ligase RMA1H1-like [Salvia miltiorrhiza]|uniref:E3 ubiquitin-protein ligase RMA1H1-like n=1 Tax=Salvia miltiorrhiza TaxID=226208 RepID=UPI0025AD808A|nr:E3 ubiquitin-protein ligase RMA1H1-like [Salvia miltiorrhiza]XP_057797329.1 E3 ubiquitin-protein ligase RMA1H1-like [Salvia miltiorrhiza]XP_057797330.1 E3 ubiquitin-protein ligase RMA1H1-like [Salvia miltiorrhiza]XP_057797353.1 E3 ubiquitin-protein ligase RMA1H1-like [Salvia miltiorrhiza]XP_057797354.1 E3 ubiquitin-protein ligase RMA1H1-like [Salvia miltiorrhiza]